MKRALPICIALSAATATLASLPTSVGDRLALVPDDILIGFDEPDIETKWITVNDNVMGGRSIGDFSIADGRLVFEGSTNTNGGGFSSIRTRTTDMGLEGTKGLLFRVKGDGRTYISGLRNGVKFGSYDISYWATFKTTGEWQTVRIPFADYTPTFFGEDISGRAPDLRADAVTGAEFYIYDKKDGAFRLEIEWIGSYADSAEDLAMRADAERDVPAVASTATAVPDPTESGDEAADDSAARRWAANVLLFGIERGVPQFNNGNQQACADIYELALTSIVTSPEQLPGDAVAVLRSGLRAGHDAGSQADRAWAYRYAIDAALGMLTNEPDDHPAATSLEESVRAD